MFTEQYTIEQQQQEISLFGFNCTIAAESQPLCAWCLSEQGLDMGNGSHGICARHAVWVLQQHRERNAHRRLARACA